MDSSLSKDSLNLDHLDEASSHLETKNSSSKDVSILFSHNFSVNLLIY